jgi:hypothetical protein
MYWIAMYLATLTCTINNISHPLTHKRTLARQVRKDIGVVLSSL